LRQKISNWGGRLDIQASVDLEGLKKLRTMLEKYEGLQMMEPNDEAANWGGLRSVALRLLGHGAACSRHFQHNTFGGLQRQWLSHPFVFFGPCPIFFCFGRHGPGSLKVRYPTQCGNQVLRSLKVSLKMKSGHSSNPRPPTEAAYSGSGRIITYSASSPQSHR
jgi:hypothetical protein